MRKFICVIGLVMWMLNLAYAQQKEYEFNTMGNACNFSYVVYAQNNDFTNYNRPFVFIIGKPFESALRTFESDTLHKQPQFYRMMFVYLPNRGGNSKTKLNCTESLESLLTFNSSCGRNNLFLMCYDAEITMADMAAVGLTSIFKNIFIEGQQSGDLGLLAGSAIVKDLQDSKQQQEALESEEDQYGTFYIEQDPTEEQDRLPEHQAVKTYFGPPSAFNFTLSGLVRDKSNGEALPFATVLIKGTSNGASTNADGYFTLLKVPSDTCVIIAQYMGYDKTEIFLTPASPKTNLNIEITPSSYQLKGVSVVGHKEDVVLTSQSDIGLVKMTPRKIQQMPCIGEKDIMRSFQMMPGISASNESSSGLYVRGGTPDQNLVLYDGFTIYHVDHLYGFYSAFNSNAVKDVQLYKGGFESRFGGRLSSVTEITGKDGNQKKFNIGADIGLLSVNGFVEIPIGKNFSSIFTYRRSYKGAIYNLIFDKFNKSSETTTSSAPSGPGGGPTQNTKVTSYFYDLNGKLTYKAGKKDILSLSFFNGTDKLDNSSSMDASGFGASNSAFSMSTTDLTKYGNIGGSLKWSRKWNEKFYSNTVFSYSNYYSDRDRSQERTTTDASDESVTVKNGILENNDLKDYSIRSDYQWDVLKFCQIQTGLFGTYYDINYTYAQNDTSNVLEKHNQALLAGAYLQLKTKFFKEKLQITPGLRASYYQTTAKVYLEPRLSASYSLTKHLSLKFAWGKYYQFANRVTREDIMSGSKDFWLLSDGVTVPISSAVHYIAGLSYETNNYLFSVEGYYKILQNLPEYSLRFNPSPMGVSYDENFFTGEGYSRGIEFLVQKNSGKFNGWVSYTLGEARNHFSVYSDSYYPANQDVTHEFKAIGLYNYKRWDFSATWIYATGRPYTAPSGAYSITLLDGTVQDFYTVSSKNALRLPDYHRFDLAVNFKLLKGTKGNRKRREIGYIGCSIFNVYNRKNVWYKQFTIEDGAIIETNVNFLGITPNLNLSLKLR